MVNYIIRRLFYAVLIVICVSMLVFGLIRALPGDPIEILVSRTELADAQADPEYFEELRHELGLDKPIPIQFVNWFAKVVQGDFGKSIIKGDDIMQSMGERMVITITLGLTAFVVSNIIGPLLGIISAIRRGKLIDNIVTFIANIGITAPTFWVAILLVYLFGYVLHWLPLYGYTLPWKDFGLSLRQGIMPVFVMALGPIASTARQTRSSMLEVLGEDYIRTAWAKGLNERQVIFRHALKNSLMPVVTLQGQMIRQIFGGSFIVETIFVIPGMGKLMIDAMLSHDYPTIQAVTLILTVVVVIANLIVDLLYGWIDPRIQYE
ncbi:peptide/nickel transport system permease protein [Sporobacter termitidis DSM 10068]|uniref:Peptide/nickel transport system permease protein n=1 Tax=Sporobacter termitidis DSM 10068 TaxID=1123282 RepID=A0A1M5XTJ0_9FIRM|nr:ABC transporter permease [Sporobacter termitidis]SHI02854.1 peptide/nickel transport system permease protein [Sporobacter termitidis DSM 10068]